VVRKLIFLVISVAYPTMIVYAGLKGNPTFAFSTKQTLKNWRLYCIIWWVWLDSNQRPRDY